MNTEYLAFCPKLKAMIESGETSNASGEVVALHSLSSLGNIRAIRELLIRNKYSNTLEIGLAYGGSALTFLATLKEISPNEFHHTAIDPSQREVWGGGSLKVIADEGFSDNFTLHEDYSALVLPDLMKKNEQFDLIYIDGSHLFEDVFIDFYYASRILKQEGIMLFDDCRDPHVLKAIKFVKRNYSQFLTELDYRIIDDPSISLKKRMGNKLGIRQLCGFQKTGEPPRAWNSPFSNF